MVIFSEVHQGKTLFWKIKHCPLRAIKLLLLPSSGAEGMCVALKSETVRLNSPGGFNTSVLVLSSADCIAFGWFSEQFGLITGHIFPLFFPPRADIVHASSLFRHVWILNTYSSNQTILDVAHMPQFYHIFYYLSSGWNKAITQAPFKPPVAFYQLCHPLPSSQIQKSKEMKGWRLFYGKVFLVKKRTKAQVKEMSWRENMQISRIWRHDAPRGSTAGKSLLKKK